MSKPQTLIKKQKTELHHKKRDFIPLDSDDSSRDFNSDDEMGGWEAKAFEEYGGLWSDNETENLKGDENVTVDREAEKEFWQIGKKDTHRKWDDLRENDDPHGTEKLTSRQVKHANKNQTDDVSLSSDNQVQPKTQNDFWGNTHQSRNRNETKYQYIPDDDDSWGSNNHLPMKRRDDSCGSNNHLSMKRRDDSWGNNSYQSTPRQDNFWGNNNQSARRGDDFSENTTQNRNQSQNERSYQYIADDSWGNNYPAKRRDDLGGNNSYQSTPRQDDFWENNSYQSAKRGDNFSENHKQSTRNHFKHSQTVKATAEVIDSDDSEDDFWSIGSRPLENKLPHRNPKKTTQAETKSKQTEQKLPQIASHEKAQSQFATSTKPTAPPISLIEDNSSSYCSSYGEDDFSEELDEI